MPVTPLGSSTPHYLYQAALVVSSTGDPQENISPVVFKTLDGTTLTARLATTQAVISTVSTNAFGATPDVLLPSDGGPVLATAPGGIALTVPCAETVTPAQLAALQAQVAQAVAAAQAAASAAATTAGQPGQQGPPGSDGRDGVDGAQGAGFTYVAFGETPPANTPIGSPVYEADTLRTASGAAATDLFTLTAHGMSAGTRVVPDINGPAPLTAGTVYFVIAAGLTANAFALSTTAGGSAVNITADGNLIFADNSTA